MAVDTRIFRVGESNFYGDEILDAQDTHTSDRLKAISDAGFNGIWLRGRLKELVPGQLFKDYVADVDKRLNSLEQVCKTASKYNLGVWLFFTEPLGLPCEHDFWKKNPQLKGHKTKILDEPAEYSLCSSTEEVQNYLYNGFKELCNLVQLAGVILITSSEQVNNCWAHVLSNPSSYPCPEKFWADKCKCPRCSSRKPADIISEVINLIYDGVNKSNNPGKVVAWDWSWNMHSMPPYNQIIDRIDPNVILMGDFERGLKVNRLGKQRTMEEYSVLCSGPSDRFISKVATYGKNRKIFAKLQINTTHELATVANLPLIGSIYNKVKYMKEKGVSGTMACWNFGCFTDTLNSFAFNSLSNSKFDDNKDLSLKNIAKDYFDTDDDIAGKIVKCWYEFQNASKNYPVNGYLFLYWSPINYALGYPLRNKFANKPMGPSWVEHEWGDRLEDSLGESSFDEMITLLASLSDQWNKTALEYENVLNNCDNKTRVHKEICSALIAGCSFQSVYNIYRWYNLKKYSESFKRAEMLEIINDEIENLERAVLYIEKDPRVGYHQEAQAYMYDMDMIKNKLEILKQSRTTSGQIDGSF